jgi:hypothetical protein
LAQPPAAARSSPQGGAEERTRPVEAVVYDRDLLLEAALEASRLLTRALNTFREDPEFVAAVNETIRRIYTIDASRAHDG